MRCSPLSTCSTLILTLVTCTPTAESPGAGPPPAGSGGATGSAGGTGGSSTGGTGGAAGSGGATVEADAAPPPARDASAAADAAAGDAGAAPGEVIRSTAPVPSAACAGGARMPGPDGNQTIQANGKSRTFIIRMPTGYDGKTPLPVMFAFHGAGAGASSFEGGSFGAIGRMAAAKATRIFPQALGGTWSRDEPDDVIFMDAIMAWLGGHDGVCFDSARVYATGHSSGAYFSHRFACDRGNVVRAVGTNSGGQRQERTLDCKVPVSAWLSTGRSDKPGHVMGTRQARDVWIKLAGCSTTGVPTTPSPCLDYPGCRPGYAVHYCEHGGGHALPGFAPGGIYDFLFGSKP
jgi:poly(3-hydroxybutyrate) depolymerase